MEQDNVVKENGKFQNLREDLPRAYRFISEEVTIRDTDLRKKQSYLQFIMTFEERAPIEIPLEDGSKVGEIFSMFRVEFQKELNNKKLLCYSGMDGIVWAIGSTDEDWIVNILKEEKPCPYSIEEMVDYHSERLPSDEEWKAFCKGNNGQE